MIKKRQVLAFFVILCQITILFSIVPIKTYASTTTLKDKLKNSVVICTNSTKAYVNNKQLWIDASKPLIVPVVINKTTLVPIEFAASSFKASIKLTSKTKEITIKYGKKTGKFKLGSKKMSLNGKNIPLPTPAQLINGQTYIPLQGIVDNIFGKKTFTYSNVTVIGDKTNFINTKTDKSLLSELTNLFEEAQLSKRTVYSNKVQALLPKSFAKIEQYELSEVFDYEDIPDTAYSIDDRSVLMAFNLYEDVVIDSSFISSIINELADKKNKSQLINKEDTIISTSLRKADGNNIGYYEMISKFDSGSVYSLNLIAEVDNKLFICSFACEKKDMIQWQNTARRIAKSLSIGNFTETEEPTMDQVIDGISLNYKVSDALIDSNDSVLYITDKENKKLHKVNYLTGNDISISFDFAPERMAVDENNLYVTLTKKRA